MKDVERRAYLFLLVAGVLAALVAMVAGPLSRTALAIGAAASAILIACCLVVFSLWAWDR